MQSLLMHIINKLTAHKQWSSKNRQPASHSSDSHLRHNLNNIHTHIAHIARGSGSGAFLVYLNEKDEKRKHSWRCTRPVIRNKIHCCQNRSKVPHNNKAMFMQKKIRGEKLQSYWSIYILCVYWPMMLLLLLLLFLLLLFILLLLRSLETSRKMDIITFAIHFTLLVDYMLMYLSRIYNIIMVLRYLEKYHTIFTLFFLIHFLRYYSLKN